MVRQTEATGGGLEHMRALCECKLLYALITPALPPALPPFSPEFIAGEEEAKRERGMVDAILSKIAAEDVAEAAQKAKAREETIKAIEEFKGQRERAVAATLAGERQEAVRIAAFLENKGAMEAEHKQRNEGEKAEREAKYRALVIVEEARRRAQEEEDQLRWILIENETDRRRETEEKAKKAREEKMRGEMMKANDEQKL